MRGTVKREIATTLDSIARMKSGRLWYQFVGQRERCFGLIGGRIGAQSIGQSGDTVEETATHYDRDRQTIAARFSGMDAESAIRSGGRLDCLSIATSSRDGTSAPRKLVRHPLNSNRSATVRAPSSCCSPATQATSIERPCLSTGAEK